ncbi:unnamed protein product [Cuscuta campestris]|uniref:Uncharacterized protein n=1 Tax=Cuscuta campestris TaxID=132261 RepID=A0A484M648_9ASTE|nr:unnamed protein product [Cuscuta campestris]
MPIAPPDFSHLPLAIRRFFNERKIPYNRQENGDQKIARAPNRKPILDCLFWSNVEGGTRWKGTSRGGGTSYSR